MSIVKLQIDLKNGTVSLEAPAEVLDSVFDRLENFVPRLCSAHDNSQPISVKEAQVNLVDDQKSEDEQDTIIVENPTTSKSNKGSSKPKGQKKNSSSRPESYKPVDLGLDEQQRSIFKEFYQSKKPNYQNEQVLVIMYWLLNNTERETVSKEEIFTAFKTVGERVPKRISSVISNIMIDGMVLPNEGKYQLHHTAEDFVKLDLPAQKNKKTQQ